MLRHTLAALLGLAPLVPVIAADAEKGAAALSLLKTIDDGFVQVFEKVAPSVVVIVATKAPDEEDRDDAKTFEFFFKNGETPKDKGRDKDDDKADKSDKGDKGQDEQRSFRLPAPQSRSEGSGFIIRADGYIITNFHVVSEAEKLSVRLKDGRSFPAKIVGTDDKTDIAVLRIEATDLPVAEFGDSDALRVGQLVCAIGTPYNQDYSFTCGWVSGKGRTNLLGPTSTTILYEDYIQTDAFINPGNSGGPLFDVSGRVIGMNTLINGIGRGLAFAIPSSMLQDVGQQIITRGKVTRPWLGIRIETLGENATLRDHIVGIDHGVVVDTIEIDAPAYRSELHAADVIIEVDGAKVTTARDLQKEILKKKIGQTIQLTVWRGGATIRIPVATGELPGELTKAANQQPPRSKTVAPETLGLKLRDVDGAPGALVFEIVPETAASRAEIMSGDVITAIDTKPVPNAEACAQAIGAALVQKGAKGVLLNLDRQGKRTFTVLKPLP